MNHRNGLCLDCCYSVSPEGKCRCGMPRGQRLYETTEGDTAEWVLTDGEWKRNGLGWRQSQAGFSMEVER